ncbi:TonB-linked outer membrane protein, SusC/RagA family [Sinomicrobium oceani]|uniref:TonB-linked outer membrane protein, SusC/RagA family n=1 Tax=Sinomicrobium oceani TaxID=1150368 RepID=A0A1K1RI93_9FLAO|nr:SusC/RagA family TonB-linked outer membrane protein [Sinomicrobium oceani]SFW71515.1 TonB-linked outer membrane protein, SusC/RagA family [Sinomicrobium oceani]
MKKLWKSGYNHARKFNFDLKMKLSLLLLFTVTAALQASNTYSQKTKISLDMDAVPVSRVIDEIEMKTEFRFIFNIKAVDLSRKVSINAERETIDRILKKLFDSSDTDYEIMDRKILLKGKTHKTGSITVPPVEQDNVQGYEVSGTITDNQQIPLGGANVMEKGTSNGAVSDFDGKFTITISDEDAVLVVSYVGFTRKEIPVRGETTFNIVLEEDAQVLDAVVVTALGIKREKKALTYAVSEVDGGNLTKAREINVGNALSGRVAGVTATPTSGGPAASSRVIIRGNGSLNGNNQPLYVVNGMPITNTNSSTPGTYGGIDRGDGLSSINPDDIESISVLKGGTAAALYGARAANGVILITTKSGRGRKGIGVELHSNFTAETAMNFLDWQYQYGSGSLGQAPTTQGEAVAFGRTSWGAPLDGSMVIQPDGEQRPYTAKKNNVENFYQSGSTITNSVALTGGSEKINFRFAASNMDNKSIVPHNKMNRKTFNLNVNASLAEKIEFSGNAQYSTEEVKNRTFLADFQQNPNAGTQLIATNIDVRTLAPGYLPNGDEMPWSDYIYATNPYFAVNKIRNGDTRKRFIGSFSVSYNITDFLYARARIGMDQINTDGFRIEPSGIAFNNPGSMWTDQSLETETNIEAILGVNLNAGDFSINAIAGGNQMRNLYDGIGLSSGQFNIPFRYFIGNGSSQNFDIDYGKYGINSLFFSADVDYKDYLYLTLTGRNDWFSTLDVNNNNLFYPSVGLSFLLTQAWTNKPEWLSYAKVRSSWAEVGGGAPSPYAIAQTYSAQSIPHLGQTLTNVTSGTIPTRLVPYTSTTIEAGIELRVFQNRLGMDLTLYDRTTTDDIVNASIAPSSGYDNVALNVGKMRNRGVELMLTGTPVRSEDGLNWDLTYNMAYNKNTVLKIADDLDVLQLPGATTRTLNGGIYHFEGQPFGMIAGNRMLQDAGGQIVYNSLSGLPVPGPVVPLGKGVPPLSIGFSNNFSYKNFNLNILLDSRWGGSIYSATSAYGTDFGLDKRTVANNVRETGVQVQGVDEAGNAYSATVPAQTYYRGIAYSITDEFVQKADFIKLRSFSFGYNFPSALLEKTPFTAASLSVVGRNLLVLYTTTDNIDPESNYSSSNAQGLENFGLPSTRTFGLDVSLSF